MRFRKLIFLGVGFLIFILAGCAGSTPTNYGAYIDKSDELIELPQFEGPPEKNELASLPEVTDPEQSLVYWHPNADIQSLRLIANAGRGDSVSINLTESKNEGILITPLKPLSPGAYCLTQEDPLGTPPGKPSWCFTVMASGAELLH